MAKVRVSFKVRGRKQPVTFYATKKKRVFKQNPEKGECKRLKNGATLCYTGRGKTGYRITKGPTKRRGRR